MRFASFCFPSAARKNGKLSPIRCVIFGLVRWVLESTSVLSPHLRAKTTGGIALHALYIPVGVVSVSVT